MAISDNDLDADDAQRVPKDRVGNCQSVLQCLGISLNEQPAIPHRSPFAMARHYKSVADARKCKL